MFVTNWISTTKIQKISEITNFFRHYFLSRTEVINQTSRRFVNDVRSFSSFLTTKAALLRLYIKLFNRLNKNK